MYVYSYINHIQSSPLPKRLSCVNHSAIDLSLNDLNKTDRLQTTGKHREKNTMCIIRAMRFTQQAHRHTV